jgi:7-cyano-7-deazaguanine synthase
MNRVIVVLSGGLDSTVLMHHLRDRGDEVHALSIHYGQRHAKELEHAARAAKALGVTHEVADLSSLRRLLAGSALTSPDVPVPEGHYEDESMKATVVPNRNMLLLSVAAGFAISRQAEGVAYGAHAGDHAIYPDCRPEFVSRMAEALMLVDWEPLQLFAPFVRMTKADIVREGARLRVPLGDTWSCYKGGAFHCGKCGTCVERKEAFVLAGVADPTVYQA